LMPAQWKASIKLATMSHYQDLSLAMPPNNGSVWSVVRSDFTQLLAMFH
jgi:hypothetical protein